MDLKDKILGSETLYDGKIIKLEISSVEQPNGRKAKREIIRHPGGVGIVALDGDGSIYLVRQYRVPYDDILLEIGVSRTRRANCTHQFVDVLFYYPFDVPLIYESYCVKYFCSLFICIVRKRQHRNSELIKHSAYNLVFLASHNADTANISLGKVYHNGVFGSVAIIGQKTVSLRPCSFR